MATIYIYPNKPCEGEALNDDIVAAGLPAPDLWPFLDSNSEINIVYTTALTTGQKTTLDNVVAAHVPPGVVPERIADTATVDLSESADGVLSAVTRQQMSITQDAAGLKLVSDAASPGNIKLYGTDSAGARGWYDQPRANTEGEWRFNTLTQLSDPGSGKLRFSHTSAAAVTHVPISRWTDNAGDAANFLRNLQTGDGLYIQDKDNAANWARYTLIGAATDYGSWFLLSVAYVSSAGTLPGNNALLSVVFSTPGGSGSVADAGRLLGVTVLTATTSSTYTVPVGVTRLRVKMVGGGAGGGGANSGSTSAGAAGGGGAGGYLEALLTGLASSYSYYCGTAGQGGAAGNFSGTAGGNTAFGLDLLCEGGTPGAGGPSGTTFLASSGGAGGTATGGYLQIQGSTGVRGMRIDGNGGLGGAGGGNPFGTGGTPGVNSSAGSGRAPGAGGGGAAAQGGSAIAGGNGAAGLIIVEEYS